MNDWANFREWSQHPDIDAVIADLEILEVRLHAVLVARVGVHDVPVAELGGESVLELLDRVARGGVGVVLGDVALGRVVLRVASSSEATSSEKARVDTCGACASVCASSVSSRSIPACRSASTWASVSSLAISGVLGGCLDLGVVLVGVVDLGVGGHGGVVSGLGLGRLARFAGLEVGRDTSTEIDLVSGSALSVVHWSDTLMTYFLLVFAG